MVLRQIDTKDSDTFLRTIIDTNFCGFLYDHVLCNKRRRSLSIIFFGGDLTSAYVIDEVIFGMSYLRTYFVSMILLNVEVGL